MKASTCVGSFLTFLALAICAPMAYGEPPASKEEELVDNPYYLNWEGFAVGSTKTVREVITAHDGVKIKERTSTLKHISEHRVVLDSVTIELRDVAEVVDAPQTIIIPAKIRKGALTHMEFLSHKQEGSPGESPNVTNGKETLEIAGEKLECEWIASSWTTPDGGTHSSKVWMSKEVPGHLVKWSRDIKHPRHTSTTETILVSFIAKAAK